MSMLNEIYEKQYYQNISNRKKHKIEKQMTRDDWSDSVIIDIEDDKKEMSRVKWSIKCGKNRCDCSIM